MDKRKVALAYAKNMTMIIIGTFIMGFAFNVFQAPNHITPTGFSGIASIISYLLSQANIFISPSPIYLALNVFLFIFAYKMMGKEFCIYSATGILGYALSMEVLRYVHINVGSDLLLCCIYGGAIMGVGTGLVIRFGGSTGGADMSAVLLRKIMPNLSTGTLIVIIDGTIIGVSAIVYGLNLGMYALVSCVLMGSICDMIANGNKSVRAYYIITTKRDELANALLDRVHRGVSNIQITGMYSHENHDMLFVVVRMSEVVTLKRVIHDVDEKAFIIGVNVREAMGIGFEKLHVDDKKMLNFKLPTKKHKTNKSNETVGDNK
ncbi:MAG: YitT family protein [Clostridia bacterium]|nr:YitT family protein [Clostridia bacterium]